VSTADSSAADDDSPAPTGTFEARVKDAGGTAKPASCNAQTTPATYPAQPSTAPGSPASAGPNATGSPPRSELTTQPSSRGAAATTVTCGSANGSTYPSL
jgi:hypothetical protein